MEYNTAYGYEQIDFPEKVCKEVFTKYLPLSMWDDIQLRRYTSVTEQGASMIRLIEPDYHCNAISLKFNMLYMDYAIVDSLLSRGMVLLVPCASDKYKDWGIENYLRLAKELKKRNREPLFILGQQEKDLYCNAVEKAGFKAGVNLPLTAIAALAFSRQEETIAIGNDTGVMHLIRACDCRSVTVCFEDTHLTWAPYPGERHCVIHADCADYKTCMACGTHNCRKDFSFERVWNEVGNFI